VELDWIEGPSNAPDLLSVDEALKDLAEQDFSVAKLVELRYFAGLTLREAALALGISERTANRYWAYAKAWLYDAIGDNEDQ
jgi:DNA-directed RNA polymerase specialized sigma24 family protein